VLCVRNDAGDDQLVDERDNFKVLITKNFVRFMNFIASILIKLKQFNKWFKKSYINKSLNMQIFNQKYQREREISRYAQTH